MEPLDIVECFSPNGQCLIAPVCRLKGFSDGHCALFIKNLRNILWRTYSIIEINLSNFFTLPPKCRNRFHLISFASYHRLIHLVCPDKPTMRNRANHTCGGRYTLLAITTANRNIIKKIILFYLLIFFTASSENDGKENISCTRLIFKIAVDKLL